MHFQHAFAELCRDFRTIGILRQRKAASESAKGSLDAMEFLFLIFLLGFAFSGNAKNAVFDSYRNVRLLHISQVSVEGIPLLIITDIELLCTSSDRQTAELVTACSAGAPAPG